MSTPKANGGSVQPWASLHREARGTAPQSRLTEFLLDVAVAAGAIVAALIASICLIVLPAYYLFF